MNWNLPLQDLDGALQVVAGVQATLREEGLIFVEPPEVPSTCCGRGCYECVWKDYYAALNIWREKVRVLIESSRQARPEVW